MTKLLEQAIAKVRELPEERQDEVAAMLLSIASGDDAEELDDETRTAIREGATGAARRVRDRRPDRQQSRNFLVSLGIKTRCQVRRLEH